MVRAIRSLSVLVGGCCIGCASERSPAPSAPLSASLVEGSTVARKADAAGCQAVKFHVSPSPVAPGVQEGVVTGDLEGTVRIQFDLTSVEFHGVTVSNAGTAHWVITGGILPGVTAFDTEFANRNLLSDRPGSPANVFENLGSHRSTSGVAKANLTYSGTFIGPPVRRGEHDYHGVICP